MLHSDGQEHVEYGRCSSSLDAPVEAFFQFEMGVYVRSSRRPFGEGLLEHRNPLHLGTGKPKSPLGGSQTSVRCAKLLMRDCASSHPSAEGLLDQPQPSCSLFLTQQPPV